MVGSGHSESAECITACSAHGGSVPSCVGVRAKWSGRAGGVADRNGSRSLDWRSRRTHSNEHEPLPVEQRGCRLLGAAYLPGFDLSAQQFATFQHDALTRFGESTVPEVHRIIGDNSDTRWVRLGAWCKANYRNDPGIRRDTLPDFVAPELPLGARRNNTGPGIMRVFVAGPSWLCHGERCLHPGAPSTGCRTDLQGGEDESMRRRGARATSPGYCRSGSRARWRIQSGRGRCGCGYDDSGERRGGSPRRLPMRAFRASC